MTQLAVLPALALAFALGMLLLSGCAISEAIDLKQQAITSCRDLGFIGAAKDAGAWYCYGPRLGTPGATPKVR